MVQLNIDMCDFFGQESVQGICFFIFLFFNHLKMQTLFLCDMLSEAFSLAISIILCCQIDIVYSLIETLIKWLVILWICCCCI